MIKILVPANNFEWFTLTWVDVSDVDVDEVNNTLDVTLRSEIKVVIPHRLKDILSELPKFEVVDHKDCVAYFLFDSEAEAIEFKLKYL